VLWNTGQTSNSITASQGGLFSVEVTDANGCTATAEFVLTEMQADYTYTQVETCSVQDTGTVQYMMVNQYGCDSMIVITTVLVPTLTTDVALSACTGEMAMFNGVQIPAGSSQQFLFTASSGCDSIVTVTVIELPPVEVDLLATATCPGLSDGSIEISFQQGALPFLFSLNGGLQQSESFFDDLQGGTYSVVVYDNNGCTYDTMIEVPQMVLAEIAVENKQMGCDEDSIILQPLILSGDVDAIEWLWSNGSTEPMLTVHSPGNYSVVVHDGCVEQHFNIHVSLSGEQEKDKYFFVPNAFSPNEDDVNDLLKVYPAPDLVLRSYEFRIFDRWGNQMFSATTTEESWDGIFKGQKMQPGVYVWYIIAEADICHGQVNLLNKGDVTIVR
jgi:gliding motility-associated-like protein